MSRATARLWGVALLSGAAAIACQDVVDPLDAPPAQSTVRFLIDSRVEVDDSIVVAAADPGGLTRIGWRAELLDGSVFGGDSTVLSDGPLSVARKYELGFTMRLPRLEEQITVTAFAVNAAGERFTSTSRSSLSSTGGMSLSRVGGALLSATAAQADTVVVVFGVTRPLPAGGRVADAIYNANLNEVYLTNVELNRVEIFQLSDTTFVPGGIPVGAQPWGIALWPLSNTGVYGDSVVVANSGGTNLSVVDVAARLERRRHHLPAFRVQTIKTVDDPDLEGAFIVQFTDHHFDDRPQYVGTVWRAATSSVIAVYSTTPTVGQSAPFPRRASVRWEALTGASESHFFWEQALGTEVKDTLRVAVRRAGVETVILHEACGIRVELNELGFLDTTFVRNSGNFERSLIGEGGSGSPPLAFARAMAYDVTAGITATCASGDPLNHDLGVSPDLDVRNFITNTATSVNAVAINFNGLTNLIRADSVYVLNADLRLVGTIPLGGANAGLDLNFDHTFDAGAGGTPGTDGGAGDPNSRLLFGAGPGPTIEIYDTWFYGRVVSIPIRDPVIGPLRVSKTAAGEQILFGVTSAGVVLVRLPAVTNIFPSPTWTGGQE
jgi:hypothetical protein